MPEQRTEHTIRLDKKYVEALAFASYPVALQTEGVWFHALKKNRNDFRAFMEYMGLNEQRAQGLPGQLMPRQIIVSWAAAAPIRINVFYTHVKQEKNEIWYVHQGQLTIWLADCREGRPTLGPKRDLVSVMYSR